MYSKFPHKKKHHNCLHNNTDNMLNTVYKKTVVLKYFDQINAALISRRDFYQSIFKKILQPKTFEQLVHVCTDLFTIFETLCYENLNQI